ncbi:MAG: oligosaccharide flippase family protein [Nitrososphaerales archaeon]
MDRAEQLATGAVYLTLGQAASYVATLLFYVAVARVLSQSEVGALSILLMSLGVFNTLTMLALNNAVIRFVSEGLGRGDEEYAAAASKKALKIILAASTPALALMSLMSPTIAAYINTGVFEVIAILVSAFILNMTSYCGAVMYGFSLFKEVTIQNTLYIILSRFLGIVLALIGLRLLGLTIGFLLGSLTTLLYSAWIIKGLAKPVDRSFPASKLWSFSRPIYGANIIQLLQSWLDLGVLSTVLGLGAAGAYYIAVSSTTALSILWVPLSSALFPTLSFINGSGDRAQTLEVSERALRIITALILPISFAAAAVSTTALTLVYGVRYAEASIPFAILAASTTLTAYTAVYQAETQAVGLTKPIFTAGATSTAAYLTLLATITPLLGQIGAAISRAAMITTSYIILHKAVGLKTPSNLKRSVAAAILTASTLAPIELLLHVNTLLKVLIEASTLIAVLLLSYKLLKPLNSEEAALLKTFIQNIVRRRVDKPKPSHNNNQTSAQRPQ